MHAILKMLIAAGIAASFSLNAQSADMLPAVFANEHMGLMKTLTPERRAERRKKMHEHWQQMSPEDRREIRREMKEHRRNVPAEERAAHRREMHERFEKMSPEERREFKRGISGKRGNCDKRPEDCPYDKPAED